MSFYEISADERDFFYFNNVKKETETPPHFHGGMEMIFCVDGEQEIIISGKKYFLKSGNACFIDSYEVHSLKPSGAELFVLLGDSQYFKSFFAKCKNRIPPRIFEYYNYDFLNNLYSIYNLDWENFISVSETNSAIIKLILSDMLEIISFTERFENRQNELVAEILKYATENYSSDLSLTVISKIFGYSRDYLSRLLHRYLTVNWNTFIADLRIKEAHNLLSKKEKNVAEIAFKCGFESLSTFYRAYKRVYGNIQTYDNF